MSDTKKNILFVISTYTLFWGLFLIVGILGMLGLLSLEGNAMQVGVVIGSWTPTFTLIIFFKKFFPDDTLSAFFKRAFKERLDGKLLLAVTAIQLLIFVLTVCCIAFTRQINISNLLNFSLPTLGMAVLWTATQGASGEEAGWRGFLQPSLQKKHSFLKSSLLVGLVWSFWHGILWLTSGYVGWDLLQYSVSFLIMCTSAAVIFAICHERCHNLLVPMWIHFMFNFPLKFFVGEPDDLLMVISWFAGFYALAAVGFYLWRQKKSKHA